MAISYAEALRNTRLDAVNTRAGTSAVIEVYAGTRPATGGAETTLLATLTGNAAGFGSVSAGVLTAAAITDGTAVATGTATWFRVYASDGTTHVMDGNVGTSGSDLNLDSTAITSGGTVSVTSFEITGGNA